MSKSRFIIEDAMTTPEDRTKFIGGSDAAAILGLSKWRTRLQVWQDKIEPRTEQATEVQTRGKKLEPFLAQQFMEDTGLKLIAASMRYIDPEHSFLAAEIDAETQAGENVEIKTVHPLAAQDWGEPGTDDIPIYYAAQVMHGLMVTCRPVTIVYAAIGFDDRRVYRVERDDETIAAMRAKEVEFWIKYVMPRIQPEPVTAEEVMLLYRKDAGTIVNADEFPDILDLCARLRMAKRTAKAASDELEQLENAVKLVMRDASTIVSAGQPLITWKGQSARRFDQKAFGVAHPDLLEHFTKLAEYRVFRIK